MGIATAMQENLCDAGLPEACPRCGRVGYLTHIDLPRRTKHQTCRGCGLTWSATVGSREESGETSSEVARPMTLSARLSQAAESRAAGSRW